MVRPSFDRIANTEISRRGIFVTEGLRRTPLLHYHDGAEILIPIHGTARVHYDGWRKEVSPGQVFLGYGQLPHGAQEGFVSSVIHFDFELLDPEHRAWMHDLFQMSPGHCFGLGVGATRRLLWIAGELDILEASEPTSVTRGLVNLAVGELRSAFKDPAEPPKRPLVEEIVAYMERNIAHPENIATLAAKFNASRSYITELFREQTGWSPGYYWLRLRLYRARDLLSRGHTVEHVTEQVGFSTRSGFQRAFKRHFGAPPSVYQQVAPRSSPTAPEPG